MNFEEYQRRAVKTAIYPPDARITYPALGVTGEIGELAEKVLDVTNGPAHQNMLRITQHGGEIANQVKKIVRDDNGVPSPERKAAIRKEMGGVLWYLAALGYDLDISLDEAAMENLDVLASRAERGVIQGDGDNR